MPIKRYLPKSLFGRALLIIVLPVLIMQIAVAYFFFNAHWNRVTASLSDSVAADVSVAVQLYKQDPNVERTKRLDKMLRPNMELSVALEPEDSLPTTTRRAFFSNLDKTLRRALDNSLSDPFWFDTTRYPNHIDIRVAVDEGVLRFIASRERVFAPTGFVFLFWMAMATALLTLVSIFFIRNQAKPIKKLSDAADAFGRGQDIADFKPSGASEVRLAGHSFLKMRQRIKRHIEQRTLMLAGVSHDLRTPLTRLKLHLAMEKDSAETRAARDDIEDMERMLEGYLDFARGLAGEETQELRLSDFLSAIVEKRTDPKPELIVREDVNAFIRSVSMERAVSNLISNARKYGKRSRVTLYADELAAYICVEDDGPGIPESERGAAFRAFQRLDNARNQNIDGVGLGLAIARDIVRNHGGRITLSDSEMDGLKAEIRLPF